MSRTHDRKGLEQGIFGACVDGPRILQEVAVELERPYDTVYSATRDLVAGGRLFVGKEEPTGRKGPRRLVIAARRSDLPDIDPHLQREVERLREVDAERQARRRSADVRAQRMVAAYVDGLTLEEIGARWGLTRERARQIIKRHDPTMQMLVKRRRQARANLLRYVRDRKTADVTRECPTCGVTFSGPVGQTYCSPLHRQANFVLRYHANEEYHAEHQRRIARWVLENADDHDEWQIRHAKNVLAGTVGEADGHQFGKRYLLPGSLAWHFALRAAALGWPLFDRLHPQIQAQVRDHLDLERTEQEAML